jgi:hypothetical protein
MFALNKAVTISIEKFNFTTQTILIIFQMQLLDKTNEPHHDKTNIMGLQPAWIQTSLRTRAV